MSKKHASQITYPQQRELVFQTKLCGSLSAFLDHFERKLMPQFPHKTDRKSWYQTSRHFLRKMQAIADKNSHETAFHIFTHGNSKLPFWSFSTAPFVTCPGEGICGDYCYSRKGWRNAAPFYRQIQNTLLVLYRRDLVENAWYAIPDDNTVRLYVDGDIHSYSMLEFWMNACYSRPDLSAYGYSKSWMIFLRYFEQYGKFPPNYVLNLSSGSKYDGDQILTHAMQELPCTRGEFVSVKTSGNHPRKSTEKYSDNNYRKEVRQLLKTQFPTKKVFVCPGSCGNCGKKHACGNSRMKDVVIGIGIH